MIPDKPSTHEEQSALLAEDDEMIRDIVAQYLVRLGYKVFEANDGAQAIDIIEKLENGPFDLLVTDLLMPGASGESVVKTAKAQGACDRFLIISGFASHMRNVDPILEGNAVYLEKPFTFNAFEEKVDELNHVRS